MIGVLDYGVGNIASIVNILKKAGAKSILVNKVEDFDDVTMLILPGVGSFDYGMKRLKESGLIDRLNTLVLEDKLPILGICLGMQLMCKSSEEGIEDGLGWIDAEVKKFNFNLECEKLKIPHMGWNDVFVKKDTGMASKHDTDKRFYFVHSYFVTCNEDKDVLFTSHYCKEFVAGFQKGNVIGLQFHPEKSHRFGLEILKRFINLNAKI